jgi:hypothetical protein
MSIHKVGYFGLFNTKQVGNGLLLEFAALQDFEHGNSDLRMSQIFRGV